MFITEEERTLSIKQSLEDRDSSGKTRSLTLSYRGELIDLPVIRLQTNILLLNHDNNRLSAQLDGHPSKKRVYENPTSAESQNILRSLLGSTNDFKELKLQLKNIKQQQPGLTTREGLLINGNTRLAALIELEAEGHAEGIDVAVLPSGVRQADILDIEMTLQMTNLVHQDYSFTNELLLMKRYRDSGKTNKELAVKMAWQKRGEKKATQHLRVLGLIEEVRRVSKSNLPYSSFDTKKQLFLDLDEKYQALKDAGEIQEAESLKWSRVTAMFLGINKDQVRAIDEDFIQERLLNTRLKDSALSGLKEHLERFQSPSTINDPHGIFDTPATSNIGNNIKAVFEDLINSDDLRDEHLGVKKDLGGVYAQLHQEIKLAARAKISEENHTTMMLEPARILREVRVQVDTINAQIPELSGSDGFKNGKFMYEIDKLIKSIEQVKQQSARYM